MISAQYLGMPLEINDLDHANLDYFAYCAKHDFRLQRCTSCKLFRYPPSTACPWCTELDSEWVSVEGRGTVHSYTEVHHAIQPAFKQYTPYLVLLVELDTPASYNWALGSRLPTTHILRNAPTLRSAPRPDRIRGRERHPDFGALPRPVELPADSGEVGAV